MAETSKIEWTDATWNPITGCSVVSPGGTNCYAMKLAGARLRNHPSRIGLTTDTKAGPVWTGHARLNTKWLVQPLRWKRPRRIFVCAHGDLFHEGVPDYWIDQVFAVMALCPQHTFQVRTKRARRMREYFAHDDGFGRWGYIEHHARKLVKIPSGRTLAWYGGKNLPNVWLGVSVEDQARADERIPDLLATPAAVRFASHEPALGPVDWMPFLLIYTHEDDAILACSNDHVLPFRDPATTEPAEIATPRLDWIITGGESGPQARPMHPDWARQDRDQCAAAGVAFFFQQWGAWVPDSHAGHIGEDLDGCQFGEWHDGGADWVRSCMCREGDPDMPMFLVGKARAGRLLDGVEHNGMPEVAP